MTESTGHQNSYLRREWCDAVFEAISTFPRWRHADVTSPDFATKIKSPELRRCAERYTRERGHLLLVGPTGAGKTSTAIAIANRHGREVFEAAKAAMNRSEWEAVPTWELIRKSCFVRAAELVRALRGHPLGKGDAPELTRAFNASWLVLDDLGNEPPGSEHVIFELLDVRYQRKNHPTCVTSGFTREQIEHRYSAALVRRLVEPSGTIIDDWEPAKAS